MASRGSSYAAVFVALEVLSRAAPDAALLNELRAMKVDDPNDLAADPVTCSYRIKEHLNGETVSRIKETGQKDHMIGRGTVCKRRGWAEKKARPEETLTRQVADFLMERLAGILD